MGRCRSRVKDGSFSKKDIKSGLQKKRTLSYQKRYDKAFFDFCHFPGAKAVATPSNVCKP